ncbi:MAG: hypothetical protein H6551_08215 [Chitinophagales bacterium]|nr:hypothetical protein [Chitinophagaceae bacterium]MCB9065107.1 hypothetical protein [Chitinophagales bacterium]
MRLCKHIAILLLSLLYLSDKTNAAQPFSKILWLNESNTPIQVNCIAQDKHDLIWLGTEKGLYRFDGRDLTLINTIDNLPVTTVTPANNTIWIGFDNGTIGQLKDGRFSVKKLDTDIPESAISAINVLSDNILLVSTEGQGVYFVTNTGSYQVTNRFKLSDNFVYQTVVIGNSALVATDQGINEITYKSKNDIAINTYTTQNGLPDNIVRVIKPMQNKCWSWIGTHQGGLAFYCSKKKTIWAPQTGTHWQWGQINDILPIGDNLAWICTESGYLIKATVADSTHLNIEVFPYTDNKLKKLLVDKTGNIWCATNTGLRLFTAAYMSDIPLQDNYSLSSVTAITCGVKNTIWVAQGKQLFKLTDNKLKHHYTAPESITSLYSDDNNTLWIGTFGQGLYRLSGSNAIKVTGIAPLHHESVLDIEGQQNKMWIAGLNGIEELEVENEHVSLIKIHNKHSGIGSDYVYEIFNENSDNIWMATDGAGVCKYRNGKYTLWDTSSGMISKVIYGLTKDGKGNIWASTLNKGLLKLEENRWMNFNREHGLQDLNISAINTTGSGHIIIVHAKGIDILYPESNDFRHFNRRLGIGMDSVSRQLGLTTKDKQGNVYVPYQGGIIRFNNIQRHESIAPNVYISGISAYLKEPSLTKHRFKHSQNHISFYFEGVNFSNPEHLFFRYKLEGYNDMWVETRDEAITFPQLQSGTYTFRVQASMNNSFNNFNEASYTFTIAKPFWQQIWFLIFVALLVWGVSYVYIRIREKKHQKSIVSTKRTHAF